MDGDENVMKLISEYEDVIRFMKTSLEVSKEEHENLKEDLLALISENQNLSSKLDAEYRERLREPINNDFSQGLGSEIIINLQSQLEVSKKEKERLIELYKTSLKLIEKLEQEVSSPFGECKVNTTSPLIAILEAKLKNTKEHLDMVVNAREKLESETIEQQTEIAKLKLNLEANNRIIEDLKSKEEDWKTKCFKLDQNYTLLNATYECVVQSRDELEKRLEGYSGKIQELIGKNNESRNKVEEALDLVEKALAEKNEAVLREIQLNEEIKKLRLCLEHVIDEAGKKVGTEVEETRKKLHYEKNKLSEELSEVRKELDRKKVEHKRLSLKYKKMEKLVSGKLDKEKISLIKGSETEITILENRLDSVHEELEIFKTKYEEIVGEKTKCEDELRRLIENHEIELKEKEMREHLLTETIDDLKRQIERKIEDLNEASARTEFFIKQVQDLQEENKKLKNRVSECNCEKLKAKLKRCNEIREKQRLELESHVESQMKLNENWKKEVKEITEKFEERIRGMKKEAGELKARNKKMVEELKKKISLLER